MNKILKYLFFALFVRPLVYVVFGLNVRNSNRLPKNGPAILVSNHSSHIDTLVLMSLFNLKTTISIHPIAARDYFFKTKLRSWLSMNVIGIVPITRDVDKFSHSHPLEGAFNLLKNGEIIIIFPEGTRSMEDRMGEFKRGVAHLAKLNPEIPVIPIYMHGPGNILPKGTSLLVPFICDVYVGNELYWDEKTDEFMKKLKNSMEELRDQHNLKETL